jgi:hypothetical protein
MLHIPPDKAPASTAVAVLLPSKEASLDGKRNYDNRR